MTSFSRAPKGSRRPTNLQRAIRDREGIWGTDLVDHMIRLAAALKKNPSANLGRLAHDVRPRRRAQVVAGARDLAAIAGGAPDPTRQHSSIDDETYDDEVGI